MLGNFFLTLQPGDLFLPPKLLVFSSPRAAKGFLHFYVFFTIEWVKFVFYLISWAKFCFFTRRVGEVFLLIRWMNFFKFQNTSMPPPGYQMVRPLFRGLHGRLTFVYLSGSSAFPLPSEGPFFKTPTPSHDFSCSLDPFHHIETITLTFSTSKWMSCSIMSCKNTQQNAFEPEK